MRRSTALWLPLILGLSACASDDAVTKVDDYVAAAGRMTDRMCECLVEAEYSPSQQACMSEMDVAPTSSEQSCLADKVEEHNLESFMDCVTGALEDYVSCLEGTACTELFSESSSCDDAAMSQCDSDISDAVSREIDVECFGAFVCGDGETVDAEDVCDDYADCSDGSDEVGC